MPLRGTHRIRVHVDVEVSLVVSKHGPRHPGPRLADCQDAFALSLGDQLSCLLVEEHGLNSEKRKGCAPWLRRRDSWERREHVAACFRLPPGVYDSALRFANDLMRTIEGLSRAETKINGRVESVLTFIHLRIGI